MIQGGGNKPGVTKVFIVFSKFGLRTCTSSLLFQSVCNLLGSLLRLESLCVTLEFDFLRDRFFLKRILDLVINIHTGETERGRGQISVNM
jgi:hypothetical protein